MSTAPVALITGGAGGIGAAIGARLAARGYRLVVADVDAEAAAKVAEPLGGLGFQADVSDHEQNKAMVAFAEENFGRLDLAILNAGVRSEQSPDVPLDLALYRQVSGVNVDGVVFGVDAALPLLRRAGGAILVTASLAALGPEQANPVYAMGKSAVLGYVRALAASLAQHRITINAVCPGFVDTAILGISKRLMRKQGFPLLTPDDVAGAMEQVLDGGGSGQAWALVAGRAPACFDFPPVPATLLPDGSEVQLRPFLAPR
jgi:NAD(P)-dependent dehydrogenase (short-subunit alcohol dehydrogenase family)